MRRAAIGAVGDVVNSTHTLADVPGLVFNIDAATEYFFRFVLYFVTGSVGTGLSLSIAGPTSPTFLRYGLLIPTLTGFTQSVATAYGTQFIAATSGGATPAFADINGCVINGVNAGALKIQFSSETAGSAVTVLRGSHGTLWPT